MKILKIIVVTLFVIILIAGAGIYLLIKNFNIDQYRPQITAEISKQLGRTVVIDKLGLDISLSRGVYAVLEGLSVSEDAAFGSGPFLTIKNIDLTVDVLSYLTQKAIVVSKVNINAPQITIIRNSQGLINAQKIGPPAAGPSAAATAAPPQGDPSANAPAGPAMAVPEFTITAIHMIDGRIRYLDQMLAPALDIVVNDIALNISNFSLDKPMAFDFSASLWSAEKNLFARGQAEIRLAQLDGRLSFVEVETDLARIDVAQLLNALPQLAPAGLKSPLAGHLTVRVPALTAKAAGLSQLEMNGKLSAGKVSTALLPVPIENISIEFTADARDVKVHALSLSLLSGVVSGSAVISDYQKSQGLTLDMKAQEVPPASLIGTLPEGIVLEGGINAAMKLTGAGLANPDLFLSSLNGSGHVAMKDGKLKDFNVLKVVLSRIQFLSGLVDMAQAGMPPEYREYFIRNDTILREAGTDIEIINGVVKMPNINVLSDLFTGRFQLSIDPKLQGAFAGEIQIPEPLSRYLGDKAEPLSYLKNSEGLIVIPLKRYEGLLTQMTLYPDVKDLGKAVIQNEGRKQLDKLLDKVLDRPSDPDPAQPRPPDYPKQEEPKSPQRQILEGVLDSLLN